MRRVLLIALLLTAVHASATPLFWSEWTRMWGGGSQTSVSVTVSDDEGHPIVGAQILIGQALNTPFVHNWLRTDNQGVAYAPGEWVDAQPVSVYAPGFVRVTYLDQIPMPLSFRLKHQKLEQKVEVSGNVQQFGNLPRDGFMDFAIVTPTVSRADIFGFSISQLISTDVDVLNVYNQNIALPSNFALPRQTENYGIFPVTVDKPFYHMPTYTLGARTFAAIRGKFPFQKVIDAFRGGQKITDIFNDFNFLAAGQRNVQVTKQGAYQDIPVNELNFDQQLWVRAPGLDATERVAAASFGDTGTGLFPTEVKILKSGEVRGLHFSGRSKNESPLVVSIRMKNLDTKLDALVGRTQSTGFSSSMMSMVLNAAVSSGTTLMPEFLAYVSPPQIISPTKMKLSPPTRLSSISKGYTRLDLVQVNRVSNQLGTMEVSTVRWEITGLGWRKDVTLPVWPEEMRESSNRWEASFVGQHSPADDLNTFTHVTRNAFDF